MFLVSKLRETKTNWENNTPKQKWTCLYELAKYLSELIQMRFLTDYSIGVVGYFPAFTLVLHCTLLVYTMYFNMMRGLFMECLLCFCIIGGLVGAYTGYFIVVTNTKFAFRPLVEFGGKYIYHDDQRPLPYNHICSKSITKSLKSFIITITIIMLSFVIAAIGPFRSFIEDEKLVTFYELRIPYFHHYPYVEYIMSVSWQSAITIIGGISLVLIELIQTLIKDSISLSSKLCQLELEQFSDLLDKHHGNQEKYRQKLKIIFMRIAYMDNYIGRVQSTLYWRNFLSPPAFTFAIAVSIYCQYMMDYPAGYGLAVVSYVQMAVICDGGRNVIERNQRLLQALYDFKWYLLPKEYCQDLLLMIHRLQNGVHLTIGPFEELNFETLKNLTQKVYTYLMFLTNFSS